MSMGGEDVKLDDDKVHIMIMFGPNYKYVIFVQETKILK